MFYSNTGGRGDGRSTGTPPGRDWPNYEQISQICHRVREETRHFHKSTIFTILFFNSDGACNQMVTRIHNYLTNCPDIIEDSYVFTDLIK